MDARTRSPSAPSPAGSVAPQSFYLHFATIDELLWDVYAREYAAPTERLTSAPTQPASRTDVSSPSARRTAKPWSIPSHTS
jgi:AcrR family transcriptional regulator